MSGYFSAHMDYIYFVYGLSFLILSAVCYSLDAKIRRGFPWTTLALFGLAHGVNEYLELFALSLADNFAFRCVRLAVLCFSFICLLEFARKGFEAAYGRKIHPGILYSIFSVLCVYGSFFGFTALSNSCRYFLAVPGGILSAFSVYRYSYSHPEDKKRLLKLLAWSLGFYTAFTGLVGPANGFLLAKWINYDSFTGVFHFPVQAARAMVIVLSSVFIWQFSLENTGKPSVNRPYLRKLSLWILVFLIVTVSAGFGLVAYLGKFASGRLSRDNKVQISILERNLDAKLSMVEKTAKLMAGSPWIIPLTENNIPGNLEMANSVLDRYSSRMEMGICFLMNTSGTVIASSNRNSPENLVGRSLAFRSYFQKALAGALGTDFVVNTVSGKRGFCAAYPVIDGKGGISGVCVVIKELSEEKGNLLKYRYAFLVDPNGIVFLSSVREFLFRALWPVSKEKKEQISGSRQFRNVYFSPVFSREMIHNTRTVISGSNFYCGRVPLNRNGFSLILFSDLAEIAYYRLLGIIITLLLCVMFLLFFTASIQREKLLDIVASSRSQLRIEKSKQDALLNNISDMAWLKDLQGRYIWANAAAVKSAGLNSAAEAVGKTDFDLFPEELAQKYYKYAMDIIAGNSLRHREAVFMNKNGEERVIDSISVPLTDGSGKVWGVAGIARDITERKKAEEELRAAYEKLKTAQYQLVQSAKMASIGLLAGGVAHEINNPLTGVLNNVQLVKILAQGKGDFKMDDFRQMLDIIEESAQRCIKITRSLLDFSHASRNEFLSLQINATIERIVNFMEEEFKRENITFRLSLDGKLPYVSGDQQMLQQAFMDVISNSRWAIQKKPGKPGGTITIRTESDPSGKDINIYISDTGIGIPKENLDKIFEPFFTTKEVGEGTGLGLAVTYNIIKAHKGRVDISSSPGEGTMFKISLPAVLP